MPTWVVEGPDSVVGSPAVGSGELVYFGRGGASDGLLGEIFGAEENSEDWDDA